MAATALTPPSTEPPSRTDSPTLDSTSKLTKAGLTHNAPPTPPLTSTIPSPLSASHLTITHTTSPRPVPLPNAPETFAQDYHTDHILTVPWTSTSGWATPEIKPFEDLKISPLASVLHYATECFEGMKAYRGRDGNLRLFRPDRNARRFLMSSSRIALPGFEPEEFEALVKKFVGVEGPRWLPRKEVAEDTGVFEEKMIYLRPTMIATHAALGVQRPREALLFVVAVCFPELDVRPQSPITSSVSMGANGGVKQLSSPGVSGRGMRLLASSHDMIRAWPGGFGNAKVGANYGPSLVAQGEARARGYQQILWLFGDEGYVTEAGGSNFFVLWKNEAGQRELVTAPLGDGVILEGVTRASVLELARERLGKEGVEVVERKFTMSEIVMASEEGRLEEAFACGTAFFVSPISEIHFRGKDVMLPVCDGVGDKGTETTMKLKGWLKDIMYGRVDHPWGVVVEEDD